MSLLRRSALIAFAMVCVGLGSSAMAQETMYLSLSGGAAFPSDGVTATDGMERDAGRTVPDFDVDLDTGYEVSAAIGVYVKQWRFEFQYTGQVNEGGSVSASDDPNWFLFGRRPGSEEDADVTLYSNLFMINAIYDLPITKDLSAFAGAGIGVSYCRLDVDDNSIVHVQNEHGAGFAYQGLVGVAYRISPMVHLTADYRIWSSTDVELQDATLEMPVSHIVEVGVRVSF